MLHCAKCNETKDADEFPRNCRTKSGRQSYCRACNTAYCAAYYARKQAWLNDAPAPDMPSTPKMCFIYKVRKELLRDPPSLYHSFRPLTEEDIRERLQQLKAYEASLSRNKRNQSKLTKALRVRYQRMSVEGADKGNPVVASDATDTDGRSAEPPLEAPAEAPAAAPAAAPSASTMEVDDVYLLRYPWEDSPIKVGYAKDVDARVRSLEAGHNFKLQVLAIFPDQGRLERRVHALLSDHRATDGRGQEWFNVTLQQALSAAMSALAFAHSDEAQEEHA